MYTIHNIRYNGKSWEYEIHGSASVIKCIDNVCETLQETEQRAHTLAQALNHRAEELEL